MNRNIIKRFTFLTTLAWAGGMLGTGRLAALPPGDDCSNPIVLALPPSAQLGLDLSTYADDFNPPAGVDGPDVVFKMNPPPTSRLVRFTTNNSNGTNGTVLTVYRGNPCITGAPVVTNSASGAGTAMVTFTALTGQPYYIVMESGTSPATAGKLMNFYFFDFPSGLPTGDTCGNPFTISSLPYTATNVDILGFGDHIANGGGYQGADAVWQLPSLPGGTQVTADTQGSSFDTVLSVLEGSCPAGTVVAADTFGATMPDRSVVNWTTVAGMTYYVVVEGVNGNVGKVNLAVKQGTTATPPQPTFNTPLQQLGLGAVSVGAYSPSGSYLATGGDGGVVLWDTQTGQRLRTLTETASDITYSPDGTMLAFGYGGGTFVLDAETGETIKSLSTDDPDTTPPAGVQHLAFSPDGTWLAVSFDKESWVALYDVATWTLIRYITPSGTFPAFADCLAFTPDSLQLATGHAYNAPVPGPSFDNLQGQAALWTVGTGAFVRAFTGHTNDIRSIQVSNGGTELLTAAQDGTAWLWTLSSGAQIRSFAGTVHFAAFSPDDSTVATGNATTLDFWNASTGANISSNALQDVEFVRYNPVGTEVFAIQKNIYTAGIWNVASSSIRLDLPGYTGAMFASVPTSTDTEVWTGHASGKVYRWNVASGSVSQTISLAASEHVLDFHPAATAFLHADQTATPFSMTSSQTSDGSTIATYTQPYLNFITSPNSNNVSVAGNGNRFAAGGLEHILIWDPFTPGAPIKDISVGVGQDIQLVSLSPDGSKVFTFYPNSGQSNPARIFDTASGTQLVAFEDVVPSVGNGANNIIAADWSPDGSRVVTGDSRGNACVWDSATGQFIFRLPSDSGQDVLPVRYSADGSLIAVGSGLGKVRIYDSATGELICSLFETEVGFYNPTLSLEFADYNTRVIAGYADGRTFIWETDPPRAPIVAAGDPDPTNNALTVQTRSLAAYGASVCSRRGYESGNLRILSSYMDPPFQYPIDYTGDSLDDSYAQTTKANLQANIIDWMNTSSRFGRRLFLYMVDHGLKNGTETNFILNSCETISATDLDAMLDQLQDPAQNGGLHHEVTLVVDCCYSGQFVTACAPTGSQRRTVISSTSANDLAVFLPSPDLTSFSEQFFGAAYMGASVKGSYSAGKSFFQNFSIASQIPELIDDSGTSGTGTAAGFLGQSWMYAGSGSGYTTLTSLGTASLSPTGILSSGTIVTLAVDVTSTSDPQSVYAQVIPPAPTTISGNGVTSLPLVTLAETPVGSYHWEGTYTVTDDGTYTFGIYGNYGGARRSSTEVLYASVNEVDPEETRPLVAVIVAGQEDPVAQTGAIDDQAVNLTARSFATAEARQYPAGQIKVLGPSILTSLGTNVPQTANNANFSSALTTVVTGQTGARLFISLIGPVDSGTSDFQFIPGETISPASLDSLITSLQTSDPTLEVVVMLDCPYAGRYQSVLDKPNRFLVLGTDASGDGFFLPGPTYESFSRRFLEACRQGRDVYDSWSTGDDFALLFSLDEPILTDGTGNPIPTLAVGKYLGRRGVFASDAGELATICNVAPDQIPTTLAQVQIYVDFQEGLIPDTVTAQAVPDPPTGLESGSPTITLTRSSPTSMRWYLPAVQVPSLLTGNGSWQVSYEASYPTTENVPRQSQAKVTHVSITDALDIYEPSPYFDSASGTTMNVLSPTIAQNHTLHANTDEDWGRVWQIADTSPLPFSLHFELNMPTNAILNVEIYGNGPLNSPTQTDTILWTETTHDVQWLGTGLKEIYFRVLLQSGDVSPLLGYRVAFYLNSGANNGIATTLGASSLGADWSTNSVPGNTLGFNLNRSTTGTTGSFVQINATPIPVPPTTGACPGSGCDEFIDTGLSPLTVYFYQVYVVPSSGSASAWTGTFYGYTNSQTATPTPTPTPTATTNAVRNWSLYE